MGKSYKLKPNTYAILSDCIDRGISIGYKRSFKHDDDPSQETIEQEIHKAIMLEVREYFNFENTNNVV